MKKINIGDRSVKESHDMAMGLVSSILFEPFNKKQSGKDNMLKMALKLETAAANKLLKNKEPEPSRSILYRSAATIALRCNMIDESLRLANEGLSGFPPDEIKKELEDVVRLIKNKMQKHDIE